MATPPLIKKTNGYKTSARTVYKIKGIKTNPNVLLKLDLKTKNDETMAEFNMMIKKFIAKPHCWLSRKLSPVKLEAIP